MQTVPMRCPQDKSFPPVIMVNVTPMASMPITEHSRKSVVILADVKKAIVALAPGHTRVELNLHGADKVATMMLPGGVELGATTAADIAALGVKVEVE